MSGWTTVKKTDSRPGGRRGHPSRGNGGGRGDRSTQQAAPNAWSNPRNDNGWGSSRGKRATNAAVDPPSWTGASGWDTTPARWDQQPSAGQWGGPARQDWETPDNDWAAGWDGSAPVDPLFSKEQEFVSFWRSNLEATERGDDPGHLWEFIDELERTGKGAFTGMTQEEWGTPARERRAASNAPASERSSISRPHSRPGTSSERGLRRSKQQIVSALERKGIFWEEPAPLHQPTPDLPPAPPASSQHIPTTSIPDPIHHSRVATHATRTRGPLPAFMEATSRPLALDQIFPPSGPATGPRADSHQRPRRGRGGRSAR